MKVVIRTDASFQIGSGHVVRCLTLAKVLRERGAECLFVCRAFPGNLLSHVQAQGFQTVELPLDDEEAFISSESQSGQIKHAAWLGADSMTDAKQTIEGIGQAETDLLIVDHYAIDANWEGVLREHAKTLLVIDDLADREHDCDFLLDQNLVANLYSRYEGLLPQQAHRFLGPEFALLQPEYEAFAQRTPSRQGTIKRVLVYFGEADTENLTGKVITAFLSLPCDDIELDVIVSEKSPHFGAIKQQATQSAHIRLHDQLPSLALLMVKADLAIGASGATSWERCCLGLPSLVVSLANNQKPIASELNRQGYIRYMGHVDEINEDHILHVLRKVFASDIPDDWSAHCRRLVDGRGASRIASILMLNEKTPIHARYATVEDEPRIIKWMQSDRRLVKEGVGVSDWLRECLRNPERFQLFAMHVSKGTQLGFVCFERVEGEWIFDFFVDSYALSFTNRIVRSAILALRKRHAGLLRFKQSGEGLRLAVCSDASSWINDSVPQMIMDWQQNGHSISWVHDYQDLTEGDLCFYLSYGKIVDAETRSRYVHNLVVHASDLPKGRGWSPSSWLILENADRLPVTLLEAEDEVDSGAIYLQEWQELSGTELVEDWRRLLAEATVRLLSTFVSQYPASLDAARQQVGETTSYPRRRPKDSMLDLNKSLGEQFNNLRVADNESYPAYFQFQGKEFVLKIYPR